MIKELDRITVNPQICLGQPTIRGMRITVGFVLKLLASQLSIEDVLEAYPELEAEDIRQALNYAAWAVSDRITVNPQSGECGSLWDLLGRAQRHRPSQSRDPLTPAMLAIDSPKPPP